MRPIVVLTAAAALVTAGLVVQLSAQAPAAGGAATPAAPAAPATAATPATPAAPATATRATFPAQQRPKGDPELITRGKAIYEINCRACHGGDLRGGDVGGPNLLRSDTVLKDDKGELIEPLVRNGKMTPGVALVMPPMPQLTGADVRAVAEFVHDVVSTARPQGSPPAGPEIELNIVVGDAAVGQKYFEAKCSQCHSATGDLKGVATRLKDAKSLQNAWVNGGAVGGRAGATTNPVTATVTQPSGERVQGTLVTVDDFRVVLTTEGQRRSFARRGVTPRVEINDPRGAHTDLMSVYTDKDLHDVTAYLVTLK